MSLQTFEVELDHGRVIPKGGEKLPETGAALLTLLNTGPDAAIADFDPLVPHPLLSQPSAMGRRLARDPSLPKVVYHYDPTEPLAEDEWPTAGR